MGTNKHSRQQLLACANIKDIFSLFVILMSRNAGPVV